MPCGKQTSLKREASLAGWIARIANPTPCTARLRSAGMDSDSVRLSITTTLMHHASTYARGGRVCMCQWVQRVWGQRTYHGDHVGLERAVVKQVAVPIAVCVAAVGPAVLQKHKPRKGHRCDHWAFLSWPGGTRARA